MISAAKSETAPTNAALQSEVTALQTQIASLQKQLAVVQSNATGQSTSVAALQKQVALIASNSALALGPFITLDANPENGVVGPHVIFHGCNVHVVNGMGATNLINGTGNLFVGYDEGATLGTIPVGYFGPNDRLGSHNLVIGRWHKFTNTAFGGIVAGEENSISAEASSVLGGEQNTAAGAGSIVVGGSVNLTVGGESAIVGGGNNVANGLASVILGGGSNSTQPSAASSSILGGNSNTTTSQSQIEPQ